MSDGWRYRMEQVAYRGLIAAVAVAGVCAMGRILWSACRLIASDVESYVGEESIILFGTLRILGGHFLYTDPGEAPFAVIQYSPLWYYIMAAAGKLCFLGPGDVEWVTRIGRGLATAVHLATLGVLALLLRRQAASPYWVIALACGLVAWFHAPWAFAARPDALVSLCYLGAIGLAMISLRSEPRSRLADGTIAAAAFLGFVAFITKQNGAQIPGILFTFFLFRRDWRRLLIAMAASGIPLLCFLLASPYLIGPALAENAVGGLNNGIRPVAAYVAVFRPLFVIYGLGLFLAMACAPLMRWLTGPSDPDRALLGYALVFALTFSTSAAFKLGSAHNSFLDALLFLVFVLAVWISDQLRSTPPARLPVAAGCAAIALFYLVPHAFAGRYDFKDDEQIRVEHLQPVVDYLAEKLAQAPDSRFLTIEYRLANHFPEQAWVPHYYLAAIQADRGVMAFDRLQDAIDAGRLQWLLLGHGQEPVRHLGFLGVDGSGYRRVDEVNGFSVWEYGPETGGEALAPEAGAEEPGSEDASAPE